jgi:FlaA1/EpsC-like NDP-sugar epimerase
MESAPYGLSRFARMATHLVHARRRTISVVIYGIITAIALQAAYLLRFEFAIPPQQVRGMLTALLILVPTRMLASHLFRLTSGRWRFTGTGDVLRLTAAIAAGSALFVVVGALLPITPAVPRSILILEPAFTLLLTAGAWLVYRTGFELSRHYRQTGEQPRRVLIIGAGEAGEMLTRQLLRFPTGLRPIGFVDDASHRRGTRVHDVEVLGGTRDLPRIARQAGADEIAIAVPSASPADLRRIVAACEATRLPFKVLPGIAEVLAGNVHAGQLREVRIEDLLGRDPIELELPELAEDLAASVC